MIAGVILCGTADPLMSLVRTCVSFWSTNACFLAGDHQSSISSSALKICSSLMPRPTLSPALDNRSKAAANSRSVGFKGRKVCASIGSTDCRMYRLSPAISGIAVTANPSVWLLADPGTICCERSWSGCWAAPAAVIHPSRTLQRPDDLSNPIRQGPDRDEQGQSEARESCEEGQGHQQQSAPILQPVRHGVMSGSGLLRAGDAQGGQEIRGDCRQDDVNPHNEGTPCVSGRSLHRVRLTIRDRDAPARVLLALLVCGIRQAIELRPFYKPIRCSGRDIAWETPRIFRHLHFPSYGPSCRRTRNRHGRAGVSLACNSRAPTGKTFGGRA